MRALCFRLIASYRQSELAARTAGCCRYSRSCSHYAEDVLRSRAVPVALWLITLRVLSCRRPMSRTTRRKATAVVLLSAIFTLGTAGLAQAVAPSLIPPTVTRGGCEMALRGTDIGTFNRNNPLLVHKGQRITADGLAPIAIRNKPEPPGSTTVIGMSFEIVQPFKADFQSDARKGFRTFNTSVNVDNYLRLGSGLYRVTLNGTGSSPAGKAWSCAATFYVKLDGSKVPGLIAGALGLAGLAGVATATGKSDWAVGDEAPEDEGNTAQKVASDGVTDVVKETIDPDKRANAGNDMGALGCALALLAGVFGWEPGSASAMAAATAGAPADGRRFYRRGHMVRGFMGGLIAGLGLTLFMQQRGYWLLTWANTIAFPLALAVLGGYRGWRGRAFVVRSASGPEAPTAPAAPEAPVAPPVPPVPEEPAQPPLPPLSPMAPTPPITPMPSVTDALPVPPVEPPAPPPAEPPPAPWTPEPPTEPEPPRY